MAQLPNQPEGQAESGQKRQISFSGLFGQIPEFREPPSFHEWFGARLASRLLWVICALVTVFLIAWWLTRPTLLEVQHILGASAGAKDVLETLLALRRDHFEQFRDLFQLVILSALVPLFTLMAGYAFGTRQREKQE